MLSYEEKKFRDKPYTQCFECIQGSRLKCKNCMTTLVEDIIRERKRNTESSKHGSLSNKAKTIHSRQKPKEGELQIKTCYGLWMDHVYFRRTKERNPLHATLGCWPHKKNVHKRKIVKLESPRFESWSGRLFARLSKAEEMAYSPNKSSSMRA